MHIKKVYKFRNAIEIEEYKPGRYGGPGKRRRSKTESSTEWMKKTNQRNRAKKARHRLRKYFDVNDYLVTLTYAVRQRPSDMKAAKKDFSGFVRRVRREYRKRGYELKWLRNIEVGTRNAWHIHIVVNRIPDADVIITKEWKHGGVNFKLLYEKGEFAELAEYMTKTPETDPRLREASFSPSKNIPLPEPVKKPRKTWKKKVYVPKGYYLDQDSFWEGENRLTGQRYRRYTLLRLQREVRRE